MAGPSGCAVGTKSCAGACVDTTAPATGCGAASCTPCDLAHASAACDVAGACSVGHCASGWGDCDGKGSNGCEVDLTTSTAHCGACGVACGTTEACTGGQCQDAAQAATAAWLGKQQGGFCLTEPGSLVNVCNEGSDADGWFCIDDNWMHVYAGGIAVDVGIDWDGKDTQGNLLDMGGDCGLHRATLRLTPSDGGAVQLTASGPGAATVTASIAPGRHLFSWRVTASASALWVDGVKVGVSVGSGDPPELITTCGPGVVLGHRISYWWEDVDPASATWLRSAPFFFHLRDVADPAAPFSLDEATKASAHTVALFEPSGASGATWTASAGGKAPGAAVHATWVADTRKDCLDK